MKGYTKTHAIANCMDCDWEDQWYLTAPVNGKKHHEETGHEVMLEIGFNKTLERKEVRDTKLRGKKQ